MTRLNASGDAASPPSRLPALLPAVALLLGLNACASPSTAIPTESRFLWEASLLSVGTFHGVNMLLEVGPEDLDATQRAWLEAHAAEGFDLEGYAHVLIPEYAGRREFYRYKDIHHVEYFNGMFHVGAARYLPERRATLNVFKKRNGPFRFRFRHQLIEVRSTGEWVPSVYYYSVPEDLAGSGEAEPGASRRRRHTTSHLTREVVRVGRHRIETDPRTGGWRVDGSMVTPGNPDEPLLLTRP